MIDDIRVTEKNIKRQILLSIIPLIKSFIIYLSGLFNKINNIIITLTGDATGILNMTQKDSDNNINIDLIVNATNHEHTENDLDYSMYAEPNTVVKRDIAGYIYGSGYDANNTGFKLANGVDIGTLFEKFNYVPLKLEVVGNIGSNNTVSDVILQEIGTHSFRLTKYYTWVCVCSSNNGNCACC